jgi:iron complex outermembrane receptor protein
VNIEGGVKSMLADGRVSASAAVFFIDWTDLQLNLPDPFAPGRFYIANVGDATSRGAEAEVSARVHPNVDLFGALGFTRARFSDGNVIGGVDVEGNTLPNTPDYTATIGAQVSRQLSASTTVFGRAESVFHGAFQYDEQNRALQEAYSLANVRGGVRVRQFLAEAWVRNAFDTRYIPVAFTYDAFAPSGFVGESGRPRTFGMSLGVAF